MYSTVFLGLNLAAWVTIVAVLSMLLSLIFTRLREDIAFLAVIAVLYLTGVLDTTEALSGFSSPAVVVVGVLFMVIAGLVHTGVLQWLARYLLGTPKSYPAAIVRLMVPVALMSSMLSNTAVVALFINVVKIWASKLKIAPSKLLIPLSYASGMGGVLTLIGTPPCLIISGMYASETGQQMNFFAPTIPGLVCLAVGILAVVLLRRLLPERQSSEDSFSQTATYTAELLVPADCPHIGQTVSEAGLAEVEGGQLIEIVRFDREVISPVAPDEFLMGADRLVYAGNVAQILSLRKSHGLVNAEHPVFSLSDVDGKRRLHTAYLLHGCELVGRRVSETSFEHDHQLTLVAVARQGERIMQSPRDIELRVGDSLLLECSPRATKIDAIRGLRFFDGSGVLPVAGHKTLVSALIMLAMVLLSGLNVMPLLQSAMLAAIAMIVARCCSPTQAMKAIDWSVLMIFAGSVVIGTAIQKTGIASTLATMLTGVCSDQPLLLMSVMCLGAMFITEFVSNTATAAIFFPIVYQAATSLGVNPMPFLIALMIAVSSTFSTPLGSITHMLVYGPGGYRFTDFVKIGIWMNFIMLAVNIFVTHLVYSF